MKSERYAQVDCHPGDDMHQCSNWIIELQRCQRSKRDIICTPVHPSKVSEDVLETKKETIKDDKEKEDQETMDTEQYRVRS